VARREKFSKRWKKAVRLVARMHRKVFNQRNDFQHKLSRHIVNNYGIIFVEDLNVKGRSRGLLSKSVHDAGWAAFFQKLSYKAESAGRRDSCRNPATPDVHRKAQHERHGNPPVNSSKARNPPAAKSQPSTDKPQ
jgi:putative transposase